MSIDVQSFSNLFPAIASHCDAADMDALLQAMTEQHVPAGESVIKEGVNSSSLYLVVNGTLSSSLHQGSIPMGSLSSGDSFCKVNFVDPGPATMTITADTDSDLLVLSNDAFRQLEKDHLKMTGNILRMISDELITLCRDADGMLFKRSTGEEGGHASLVEWARHAYKTLHGKS